MAPSVDPRKATVCFSVVVTVTELTEVFSKDTADVVTIGDTPDIFRLASQKLPIFPTFCKQEKTKMRHKWLTSIKARALLPSSTNFLLKKRMRGCLIITNAKKDPGFSVQRNSC